MSLSTTLTALQNARGALVDAISSKGVTIDTSATLLSCASAVMEIPEGSGGTDVSSTTAESADVLSGKVFYNSGGVKTTGTIPMLYRDPVSGVVSRMGGAEARKGIDFRDPESGRKTVAQMMSADELRDAENAPPPKPLRNPGPIELGRELEIGQQPDNK